MKLKKIVENMNKMPLTLKGFNDTPKLTSEQKRKLMEMVSNYNQLGQKLKMENSLIETAKALSEISELAETYACNEASDWFATEVVKSDFKRARNISENFQKLARECHGKVQQLNALYEDMGHILERYYEISDSMQEVCPNPTNIKSQRGLPNANPQVVQPTQGTTIMQEVKPNDKNLQSQRELPANGSLKEVAVDDKNIKSQRDLPSGGPATPQLKEVHPNDKNIKSQRDLPSGGPTSYNPPKDPKDTGSVKEGTIEEKSPSGWEGTVKAMKKHKEIDNPWALAHWMKNKGMKSHKKEESINEIKPNDSNIKSQRELPSGGPESYNPPKQENPSVPVKPSGAGEMNVKGERDVPQGGPAPSQIKEFSKFPSLQEIMGLK